MIEVDAFLLIVTLVIVGAFVIVSIQRNIVRAKQLPNTDLARAMRLLDRILAIDAAFPQLPTDLRDEAKRMTTDFYRELEP